MALIEMDFLGKADTYVETLLWTNPSPTSEFTAQTITLSQSIENFDYIKISYRAGTTNTNEISAIYSVTDIKKMLDSNHIWGATMGVNSSGHYGRYITFDSNTTLAFSLAYNLGSTGNTSNVAYPTRVYGLKKVRSGGGDLLPLDGWENINLSRPYGASTYTFTENYKSVIVWVEWQSNLTDRFSFTFDDSTMILDEYVANNMTWTIAIKNNVSIGETVRVTGTNIYKTFSIIGRK